MNWEVFWGWALATILSVYALLVVAVAIGGLSDLKRLWTKAPKSKNDRSQGEPQ